MPVQLIRNGGFETGSLVPGWRQTPGSAAFDGSVTDARHHSGSYCLELRAMDFVEQTFPFVIAHATGPLTFWVKAESATEPGPFFVRVEYTDGTEETPLLGSVSTRWELTSLTVDTTKRLKKIVFGTGESGSILVDDVSLMGTRRMLMGIELHRPPASRASAPAGADDLVEQVSALNERLHDIEDMLAALLARDHRPRTGTVDTSAL
jgi:hypothetical protein